MDAIIEQNIAFGLERTSGSSFYVSATSFLEVFKKLNLTFRLHGAALVSYQYGSAGPAGTIFAQIWDENVIPGYSWSDLVPVTSSDDYCGVVA